MAGPADEDTGSERAAGLREDDVSTIRPAAAAISADALTLPGALAATSPGQLSRDDFDDDRSNVTAFAPGDQIGTFVVDHELGRGAMGIVLLAHDPELDRPVAIKLLRRGYAGATAMARMTREAQSIAKIAHPNVVVVHQVGTHQGQLFIVMEFVDGTTLRQWNEDAVRPSTQTLDVYRQAGRGLEAAHEAGLVHRDFKPDNVLIGRDGRVRVTDFGLVGAAGERSSDCGSTLSSGESDIRLTRTGFVMGTPAYMSPEQHQGQPVDERSDQFSFCVASYEALFGSRPFEGETLAELSANVATGRAIPPPENDVPRPIRDAIMQGLRRDVDERHDSMEALLACLLPPANPWPRWPILAGAGAIVVGLSLGAFALGSRRAIPKVVCDEASEVFGSAWSDTRRGQVREAFVSSGHALGADTFTRVDEELTAYAQRWQATWDAACQDATADAQTAATYDLRRACLHELASEADAFSGLLASDAERLIDGALSSATLLRTPTSCDDVDALQARPTPTAQQLEELGPLRQRLVLARVLLLSGRHHEVLAVTRELEPQLRDVGFGSDLAANLVVMARGEMQLGENEGAEAHLREAITLAAGSRAHSVEARAIGTLIFVAGSNLGRMEEALGMLPSARSAAKRSGDPRAHSYVASAAGVIMNRANRNDEAMQAFDEAIALLEGLDRPPPDELGMAYSNRAGLKMNMGSRDASLADYQKGLDVIGDGLGRKHPFYGALSMSLGMTLGASGEPDRALEKYRDALAAWEAVYGKDHTSCANLLVHIAQVHQGRNEWGRARELLEDALGRHERFGAADYQGKYSILDNLAIVSFRQGRYDEALARLELERTLIVDNEGEDAERLIGNRQWEALVKRALGDMAGAIAAVETARKLAMKRTGPKHPTVASLSVELGELHREQGHCKAAGPHYARALKTRTDLGLEPDAQLAQLLMGLGSCELAAGDVQSATDSTGRATSLIEELDLDGELAAQIRLAAAKLHWATDDRDAALGLATAAEADLETLGPSYEATRTRIERWIDDRR